MTYHLRCLSWNSVLKLVAISFSFFSPQIIGGTNRPFPASVSSLEKEENEKKKKKDEEGDEDSKAGDEVLTFWTGRVAIFFFWIGGRTVELEA